MRYAPVITAQGMLRREHSEFKASLDCTGRPCLKGTKHRSTVQLSPQAPEQHMTTAVPGLCDWSRSSTKQTLVAPVPWRVSDRRVITKGRGGWRLSGYGQRPALCKPCSYENCPLPLALFWPAEPQACGSPPRTHSQPCLAPWGLLPLLGCPSYRPSLCPLHPQHTGCRRSW